MPRSLSEIYFNTKPQMALSEEELPEGWDPLVKAGFGGAFQTNGCPVWKRTMTLICTLVCIAPFHFIEFEGLSIAYSARVLKYPSFGAILFTPKSASRLPQRWIGCWTQGQVWNSWRKCRKKLWSTLWLSSCHTRTNKPLEKRITKTSINFNKTNSSYSQKCSVPVNGQGQGSTPRKTGSGAMPAERPTNLMMKAICFFKKPAFFFLIQKRSPSWMVAVGRTFFKTISGI